MKKILLILFMFLVMFKVYAKDTIEIKSIELDSKSDNTIINSEPTFSGLEMNYDLRFKELNDFAKYKIVIENNTDKEYQVKEDKPFNISEYVTYSYSSDQIIKANTTSTIYVIIKYTKAIPYDSLSPDGSYKESNKAVIEMYDENNNIVNPRTGVKSPVLILTILMLFAIVMLIITSRRKVLFSIIVLLLMIPLVVNGIEELKLTINVNVEIVKTYDVVLNYNMTIKYADRDKYNLSQAYCTDVYYLNEMTDDNKYILCSNVFEKYNRPYKAGEKVTLTKDFLYFRVPYSGNNGYCELVSREDNGNTYLCNDEGLMIFTDEARFDYSRTLSEESGFEFYNTDYEIMNFSELISDNWSSEEYIQFELPVEFTMPNHDVLFVISVPS